MDTSITASAEVYTKAQHDIYANQMQSENEGLRRHIDNRAAALSDRIDRLEQAQSEVHGIPITIDTLERSQTRIYDDLQEIKGLCLQLDAVGITSKLDGIQGTLAEHGKTLAEHTVQLQRHDNQIEQLNGKALGELREELKAEIHGTREDVGHMGERVNKLEQADGQKALKWLGVVATAAIGVLVGGIISALGIFGG